MQYLRPAKQARFASGLLKWFEKNHRDYPWRRSFSNPDPYRILFTEIMLQRTRADQVAPVYQRFFTRYPSFDALKSSDPQDVYGLFASLGLKWRARKILELIGALDARNGEIPSRLDDLASLPGVGDYVARAVMCYAFGASEAPIDVNVIRVLSRFFGFKSNDSSRRNQKVLAFARSLVPKDRPRDFNLSLLDFGALVCKPKPLCSQCPISDNCTYYQSVQKRSGSLPQKS